jgi:hypothetical protein
MMNTAICAVTVLKTAILQECQHVTMHGKRKYALKSVLRAILIAQPGRLLTFSLAVQILEDALLNGCCKSVITILFTNRLRQCSNC